MLDRQDIDALLMGALYGELSPAESTRLEEHLTACPQDRLVLDGLGRARQALRDSHVLAVQAEPPAAVSALLLQEAARRAPEPRTQRVGWFAKLAAALRHPAMAAATVIVLVAGVASTLYLKTKDSSDGVAAEQDVASPTAGAPAPAIMPVQPASTPPPSEHAGLSQGSGSAVAAGNGSSGTGEQPGQQGQNEIANEDGYSAGLETEKLDLSKTAKEAAEQQRQSKDRLASKTAPPPPEPRPDVSAGGRGTKVDSDKDTNAEPRKSKQEGERYVEVTTSDPKPKSVDDSTLSSDTKSGRAGTSTTVIVPADPAASPRNQMGGDLVKPGVTAGGGGGGAAPAAPQPARDFATATGAQSTGDSEAVATEGKAAGKKQDSYAAARSQHQRVVGLVKSNKCKDAAKLAASIYQKYPDYYLEFVANDRNVKACKPYIENERRKASEKLKRARVNDPYEAAPAIDKTSE